MEQTINRYQSPYRVRTRKIENNIKIAKYWSKFVRQTIISGGIVAILLCCENVEAIKTSAVWTKVTDFVKSDVSVEQVKNGFVWGMDYIKVSMPEIFSNEVNTNNAILEDFKVEEEIKEDVVVEEPVVDPTIGMTQEEKDVYNILASTTVIRPLNGEITCPFGDRVDPITNKYSLHTGTDFSAVVGTQIKSAISGTVIEVKKSNVSLGNFVRVKNADIVTTYAHCSTLKVKKGDKIKQGDIIALSGNTGKSTGPHLHFEITKDGRYVDPEKVIYNLTESV